MKRVAMGWVLLTAAVASYASSESLSIELALGAPFPVEMVASPTGERFAYVLNDQGVRNIWVVDTARQVPRQLTAFKEDDGIELRGLHFTPEGDRIVYTRGGFPNDAGELPNPRSFLSGGEGGLWVIDVEGKDAPRSIDDGGGAAIHPRGETVAYMKKDQIWVASLVEEVDPQLLVDARGAATALTWSPDGRRLAFTSQRGTHSFIGVWEGDLPDLTAEPTEEPSSETLRWIDPGVDLDVAPIWASDGERLAFIRLPTADLDRFLFEPHREGHPWSIRVADLRDDTVREVWRASEGFGSVFHPIEAENQLFWTADDHLVFPWESDGWLHLYSVPVDGGSPHLLTPGAFEVEHVAIALDRTTVYYSSNQDDSHRRHIWKVRTAGGAPQPVTSGMGIEWSPVPLATGGVVAILRSDARATARPALVAEDGSIVDLLDESMMVKGPPSSLLVEPVAVEIAATDGLLIQGQLFLPHDLQPGDRRPAVIFLHGGSRRQMLLGWHYMDYYHNAYGLNQYLASRGFVVLSLNYRSGIGYGLEFREAEEYGATGASEVRDLIGAGLFLRNRPEVDPERIGLWGGSYGGYLTAHGLAQASDLFAAGVDIHGVHDWNWSIQNFAPRYDPQDYPEEARLARQSSPFHYIDDWTSPVLLIHGDDDRNVNFKQTTQLVQELRSRDVEVELLVFPDEVHDFLLHENWVKAYQAAADFLERKLAAEDGPK